MRKNHIVGVTVAISVIALFAPSCATKSSQSVPTVTAQPTHSSNSSGKTARLRQRAEDLRQFAEKLDHEGRETADRVAVRKHALAEELRLKAVEADQQAEQFAPSTAAAGVTDVGPRYSNPQKAAIQDRYYYRRLADELREMKDRLRIEAETIAQSPNADPQIVAQKRQLAEDLAATAAEAEQRALEAEQQIPHGMVPQ